MLLAFSPYRRLIYRHFIYRHFTYHRFTYRRFIYRLFTFRLFIYRLPVLPVFPAYTESSTRLNTLYGTAPSINPPSM